MVRRCLAFDQLDPLLSAELSEYLANPATYSTERLPVPVLWNNHHMVLALPLHVGLTTPIFHLRSSLAPRGLPQGGSFHILAGNGRALSILTSRAGGLRTELGRNERSEVPAGVQDTGFVPAPGGAGGTARLSPLVPAYGAAGPGINPLPDYVWTFDTAFTGRLVQETSTDGVATYTYDPRGQLIGVTYQPAAGRASQPEATEIRIYPSLTFRVTITGEKSGLIQESAI
jgi:YD repeat-containing protein